MRMYFYTNHPPINHTPNGNGSPRGQWTPAAGQFPLPHHKNCSRTVLETPQSPDFNLIENLWDATEQSQSTEARCCQCPNGTDHRTPLQVNAAACLSLFFSTRTSTLYQAGDFIVVADLSKFSKTYLQYTQYLKTNND